MVGPYGPGSRFHRSQDQTNDLHSSLSFPLLFSLPPAICGRMRKRGRSCGGGRAEGPALDLSLGHISTQSAEHTV